MPILTTAIANLLVVLAIGVVVGIAFARYGRGFLGKATSSVTGVGAGTYALVGIAGAFIGFHFGVILGLLPSPLMFYLTAIVGAVLTVWLWSR